MKYIPLNPSFLLYAEELYPDWFQEMDQNAGTDQQSKPDASGDKKLKPALPATHRQKQRKQTVPALPSKNKLLNRE